MPGLFNRLGAYMAGSMGNAGRRTLLGGAIGAGIGAITGGMSDNGSVLGGALQGGMLGAGAARYGGAGYAATRGVGGGMGMLAHGSAMTRAFGGGVARQVSRDFGRSRLAANQGFNKIKGLFT